MFGFRASLDFFNGVRRKTKKERDDIGVIVSVTGAYRTNRDEFFGPNHTEMLRKSTINLQGPEPPKAPLRQAKSTSDLIKNRNLPPNLRPENPGISEDPRGAATVNQRPYRPQENGQLKEKRLDAEIRVDKQRQEEQRKRLEEQRKQIEEQKKLEKKWEAEEKRREKLELKEQAKKEKLRQEKEKKEAQQARKKKQAPQRPVANPLAQPIASTSTLAQGSRQPVQIPHSTNTLESSISKSSGPPPYTAPEGEKDSSGNVIYTKPDTDSWDLISQHRNNIGRPVTAAATRPATKQTVMDLNYKIDDDKENSEA